MGFEFVFLGHLLFLIHFVTRLFPPPLLIGFPDGYTIIRSRFCLRDARHQECVAGEPIHPPPELEKPEGHDNLPQP